MSTINNRNFNCVLNIYNNYYVGAPAEDPEAAPAAAAEPEPQPEPAPAPEPAPQEEEEEEEQEKSLDDLMEEYEEVFDQWKEQAIKTRELRRKLLNLREELKRKDREENGEEELAQVWKKLKMDEN